MTPTLLHIDSSPLYGRSVSRELTAAFVSQWEASHPGGTVVYRDLNATAIPPVTEEWVDAVYTPEKARTQQQNALLWLSDLLLAELEQTNEYVVGVPMHIRAHHTPVAPYRSRRNVSKLCSSCPGRS
jgi:FMN-dependent NADH-azoreductase